MEIRVVVTILRKEIDDSLNNYWFMLYTLSFTGLALLLSWLSLSGSGTGYTGFAGFGRTAASLINLVLLVVPLMALTIGAGSLSAEQERGTLAYLLAQPVNRLEVMLGKYLGLSLSLLGVLALGFGLSGITIAGQGGQSDLWPFAVLVLFSFILALGMLSLGMLISVIAHKSAVATGIALFVWLLFVFVGDLGLMGTTLAFKLPIRTLFSLALLNPLQVFKMSALISLNTSLDVLGPTGIYALQTYRDNLVWLFLGAMTVWIVIPFGISYFIFNQRGDL
ncbi:ABC transporter permease subunit [Anaerolineales bacterium HSG25]|nr:ABC transporter permease subunit [Anaerolineales bacterium HSG25]